VRVAQGDVLCRFDCEELGTAACRVAGTDRRCWSGTGIGAWPEGQPATAQLALANQRLSRARLEMIERRLELATLRSPLDGIVVTGDLRKRIGSVVSMGEPLFEVSPMGDWTLELEVPESAERRDDAGAVGVFASDAPAGGEPRVPCDPGAAAGAGARGEERLRGGGGDPRRCGLGAAGHEGVAKVRIGPRRVWWVVLHRAIDYVRLKLWL